jgi:hypothetical protein
MGGDVRFGRKLVLPALFLGMTLLMLRPNPSELGNRLPGNTGDPALITWTLSWGAHTLPGHPTSYLNANIFWPHRGTLAYADSLVPLAPAYGALYAATHSWSLTLLVLGIGLTVLSLSAAYALGRWLTDRRDAAVLGAVAYTFSGFAVAQWGHVQLQTLGLLPVALLLLLRLLNEEATVRRALGLGLVSVALVLSSLYYGLAYAVAVIVIVVAHGITRRGRVPPKVLGLLALAAVVIALLVWPELRARTRMADEGFRRPLVAGFGLHGTDFLRPAFGSYVWRPLEHAVGYRDEAHRFFPGAIAALLALFGAVATIGRRRTLRAAGMRLAPLAALVAAGVVAVVLACGAKLGPFSGPFAFLYDHVPGFGEARVASRLAVVTTLALAMLAAAGFAALATRLGDRRAAIVATVAGAVMLAELAVALPWADLAHDRQTLAVYRALAHQPAGAVVELPMMIPHDDAYQWAVVEAPRMVYSSLDWHPRVNGYSGFVPPGYDEDAAILDTFPAPAAVQRARQHGVRWVVLHLGASQGYPMYSDATVATKLKALPRGATAQRHGRAWLVDLGDFLVTRPVATGRG